MGWEELRGSRRAVANHRPDAELTTLVARMSPNLRRAMHQALDVILDALAEEATEKPKKRARNVLPPELPPVESISPKMKEKAEKALIRSGWRPAA